MSKHCSKIANAHNITTGAVTKLGPNLMNKNNYVIHYRILQQCLKLGMKLKKIHRILKFKQKDWMKPYIDFNTQKRKEATDEVDKNHYKSLNNAVYGKTIYNMRKRIKIRVVKKCERQKQPPRGVLRKRCSENMQQIYRTTPMLKCDFNKVALLFY